MTTGVLNKTGDMSQEFFDDVHNFPNGIESAGVRVATIDEVIGLPSILVAGGGQLTENRYNVIGDGDTGYLFPAANVIAANFLMTISNPLSANAPVVTCQGADNVAVDGVIDTSITFVGAASATFATNGVDEWREV